jgi:hypothetical protein
MPLDLAQRPKPFENELEFLLHFQNVLLRAVEGTRDAEIDAEYKELRTALMNEPKYEDVVPEFVRRHRDLGSLWPTLKTFDSSWEPRRAEVRRQFQPALDEAERPDRYVMPPTGTAFDSSAWTGASSAVSRTAAVRTLLPVARAAIDRLIEDLDTPGHNGGPQIDTTVEAIRALRSLNDLLGQIIRAADDGILDQVFQSGLPVEASMFAKRAAKKLRDDPMPYACSALLLGILTACGFPGVGGFLSGVALNIQRK